MVKTVWLTLNRSCNLQCEWCYSKYSDKREIMNFEKAKQYIMKLHDQGIKKIILIGGEPLLYKHILELIYFINSLGMKLSITTNGILLQDYEFCKKLIKSGLNAFNMSLKGITLDEYYNYTKYKNGLQDFIDAYNNLKSLNVEPLVSWVIVDDSKERFDNLVKLFVDNNITNVCFQFVKPALTLEKNYQKQKLDEMGKFCEYVFTKMKETKIQFSLEISFPLCLIDKDVLEQMIKTKCLATCCHIQKGTGLVLDTNFQILPCNHFVNYPFNMDVKEINADRILQIFSTNNEVLKFRKKVSCYPSVKCKKCDLWDYCGGGCFTRWLYDNPDDYIK